MRPLQFITLVDENKRTSTLAIHGKRQDQDNTFALAVVGVIDHNRLIEPASVEDCDNLIAWLQEWRERQNRNMPRRYKVGDAVKITPACLKRMRDSNRSCVTPQYPNDDFIRKAEAIQGITGYISHTFPPGYEVSANFGKFGAFHMKDNWIEPVSEGLTA